MQQISLKQQAKPEKPAGKNRRLGPVFKRILMYCLLPWLVLLAYAAWWAAWYRLPAGAPATVDLRSGSDQRPYYVTFCASLADNPHGYPGHCYVVWSKQPPKDFLKEETAAFMPKRYWDQIPSLWSNVQGTVWRDAARGNMRNLNTLTAIVDQRRFQNSRRVRDEFETAVFQAGVRDCTVFGGAVASSLGLNVPNSAYTYPQDFISKLKRANNVSFRPVQVRLETRQGRSNKAHI